MPKIILRADANEFIGAGHVFRLLALAEMLSENFEIWFYTNSSEDFIISTISKFVNKVVIIDKQLKYSKPSDKSLNSEFGYDLDENVLENDVVVLDGYWFRESYQKAVKEKGAKLVLIDDMADQHFFSDIVINHAPGISELNYSGEKFTKYFLGLKYVLIRNIFFEPLNISNFRKANSFLVSFGGSDTNQLSLKYVMPLLEDNSNEIHIIITSLFNDELLGKLLALKANYNDRFFIHQDLNETQVKSLMDSCSYAVVPSSTIFLECLSRGLRCITGYQTNNQLNIYSGVVKEKLAIGVGDLNNCNLSQIRIAIDRVKMEDLKKVKFNSKLYINQIFNNLIL